MSNRVWVTNTQTQYMPCLHMVERFARADYVILMDEAGWSLKGGHSRAPVFGLHDWSKHWCSFEIQNRKQGMPLYEVRSPDIRKWAVDFSNQMRGMYRGSKHADRMFVYLDEFLFDFLSKKDDRLNSLNYEFMLWLFDVILMPPRKPKFIRSLDIVYQRPEDPTEWMCALARSVKATDYMQGRVSMDNYFRTQVFEDHGIRLWYQDFGVNEYAGPVSILDPLFRYGVKWTYNALRLDDGPGSMSGTLFPYNDPVRP